MATIRIERPALEQVERAFEQYSELVDELERQGTIEPNTAKTYLLHSGNFVRWLRDEFEPGARNKR